MRSVKEATQELYASSLDGLIFLGLGNETFAPDLWKKSRAFISRHTSCLVRLCFKIVLEDLKQR